MRVQIRELVPTNLDIAANRCSGQLADDVLNVEGGWSAILQVPRVRSEEEWALMLLGERDVLVQPGYFFDFESEAFLVVSLLTPSAIFEEGIRRLI